MKAESNTPSRYLAVIGSRKFPSYEDVVPFGIESYGNGFNVLVSGGARGVDERAERYAKERGWRTISYRPEKYANEYAVRCFDSTRNPYLVTDAGGMVLTYKTFPEAAKARNWWIVQHGDFVIAFWDGMSSGTAHGIAAAARLGADYRIWMEGDS